jgi:hypothetical protein
MRRRVTLVLSSLLTVAALACGGWLLDPAGSREPAGLERAAQVGPTASGPSLYEQVTQAMVAAGTATYTFSGSSGGGETQSGSGSLHFLRSGTSAPTFDADVTMTSPTTGQVRAVLLPGAFYLALPPAQGLPKDKPWLKVSHTPTTDLGRQLRPVAEQLQAAFDPGQSIGLLQAAGGVEEVGPATVEGVPATLHRTSVDLRRAAQGAEDPAVRDQYRAMLAAGVRTLQLELWLDAAGRPLRVRADGPATRGVFSVTGVYRSWGKPVRIAAPTDKQVFDANAIKG